MIRAVAVAVLALVTAARPAASQRIGAPALAPVRDQGVVDGPRVPADSGRPAPWYAGVLSLAIPGAGQAVLGQSRALAYGSVEIYALLEYHAQHAEAMRGRARYRSLARDIARAVSVGARPPGPFEYYESMEKFIESGAFDRVGGGDIDPEIDERTFNGFVWRLARETYWADPDVPPPVESAAFASAISAYLHRAVRPEFAWSWRNAALEHDLYKRSIRHSNAAFRRAREQLGLLLANHLLSMADAFATVRVRAPSRLTGTKWGLELGIPF